MTRWMTTYYLVASSHLPMLRRMVVIVALALAACRTISGKTNTAATEDWACLAFQPIRWSSRDTKETLDQIAEHNAVWEALCGES